jgi:hypothetical protein
MGVSVKETSVCIVDDIGKIVWGSEGGERAESSAAGCSTSSQSPTSVSRKQRLLHTFGKDSNVHKTFTRRAVGAVFRSPEAQLSPAPLDYMLRLMRDETADEKRRDDMAKAAAPFVHARISPIETPPRHLSKLTNAELDDLERITRKIANAFGDRSGEAATRRSHS